jgi:hypothetical protein
VSLPASVQLMQGSTATVPVSIDPGSAAAQLALRVTYDPRVITVQDVQLASAAGGGTIELDRPAAGAVRIIARFAHPLHDGGTLLELAIAAIATTPSATRLAMVECVLDAGAIGCAPHDANVVVQRGIGGQIRTASNGEPVSGATVAVRTTQGDMVASSDDLGQFIVADRIGGGLHIEPMKDGDVRGAITAYDAALVLRAAAAGLPLDTVQALACDVDGDGRATAVDASRILQLAIRPAGRLPIAERCGSDWAFIPEPMALPAQRIIDPQLGTASCQPGGIALDAPIGNVPDQNFAAVLFGDCSGNWAAAGQRSRPPASGQVRVRVGRPRRRGADRWLVPLYVMGPCQGLDLRLAYEPSMRAVRVATSGAARDAMVQYEDDGQVVSLALATSTALPPRGGRVAILELASSGGARVPPNIRVLDAAVDEVPVSTNR